MSLRLSRLLALAALAALLPLAVACDESDPSGRARPVFRDDPPGDPGGDPDSDPLEVDVEALNAAFGCDVVLLKPGEPAEADLADAACRLDDGRLVAYYAFASESEDAAYTVEAASAWFDTVLGLYDDKGDFLAENDDLGSFDTNSRLDVELKRGVYVAAVSSFDASTGLYRVSVSE